MTEPEPAADAAPKQADVEIYQLLQESDEPPPDAPPPVSAGGHATSRGLEAGHQSQTTHQPRDWKRNDLSDSSDRACLEC